MKLILTCTLCLGMVFNLHSQPVKIMLVTGGHSYDTLQFFQMFDALEGIEYEHYLQPSANKAIASGQAGQFDVLVFYDMWRDVSEQEQQAYIDLTKQGKPILFLHHALASYQKWPEFEKILGGKYIEKGSETSAEELSTYKHDVWINVQVPNPEHPVTKGIKPFRIFDEVYGNFRVLPKVTPLLKTDHTESGPVIAWENRYNSSVIVFLQPGHDKNAYESENYRRLILQSIKYLAGMPK
jgi:uncharacterized protein